MGTKTGISWTDATWNPIRGCSRVSEGCRHCYAERVAYRFSGTALPYEGLVQISADGERRPQWNGKVRFVEEHLLDPLRWNPVFIHAEHCAVYGKGIEKGCTCGSERERPRRIFVNSMSDLFHENVTDEMRDRIFAVMALCPQHAYQVLTKRPEADSWPLPMDGVCGDGYGRPVAAPERLAGRLGRRPEDGRRAHPAAVTDACGAQVHLGGEPLLGSIDLTNLNGLVHFHAWMAKKTPHDEVR